MVKFGVVNIGPLNATLVSEASLYQVNTGLVTVVELALITTEPEPHTLAGVDKVISAAVAPAFTVTVTTLAVIFEFSHLLSPLTVT
ncbi:hypothetical protein D3C85_904200 [compost metagenome]